MTLKELERNVRMDDGLVDLCKRTSLVSSIIRCAADDYIAVAKKAMDIIYIIGKSNFGLKTLVSSENIEVIREVMTYNELVRVRFYEVSCLKIYNFM